MGILVHPVRTSTDLQQIWRPLSRVMLQAGNKFTTETVCTLVLPRVVSVKRTDSVKTQSSLLLLEEKMSLLADLQEKADKCR